MNTGQDGLLTGPEDAARQAAIRRWWRVETMCARMSGMNFHEAEAYFDHMLAEAPFDERDIVKRFIDAIRTARRALPS